MLVDAVKFSQLLDHRRITVNLGRYEGGLNLIIVHLLFFKIILLGNKCDQSSIRIVTKEEMQQYSEQLDIVYIECSCKENFQIHQAFDVMINLIICKMSEVMNIK